MASEQGYDISFTLPVITSTHWIGVWTDARLIDWGIGVDAPDTGMVVAFYRNAGNLEIWLMRYPGLQQGGKNGIWEKFAPQISGAGINATVTHEVRVILHGNFCTIYMDERWLHSIHLKHIVWIHSRRDVALLTDTTGMTVTNIINRELYAWREAVYVEMEATGSSGIQSVIQERPIEITPTYTGDLEFSYNKSRSTVSPAAAIIRSHVTSSADISSAGSDAIVYYSNVGIVQDATFAAKDGFATRVYRLSNLSYDAIEAAIALLKKSRESQVMHRITMRPHLGIEVNDIIAISYITTGHPDTITASFIAESITVEVQDGRAQMTIQGRNWSG